MKTKKYQSDDERTVLTGMIVNDRVVGRIATHLKSDKRPFKSKWSNLVGNWCLEHFSKYQKAPRASIQILFRDFASSSSDEEAIKLIESFLGSLSDDYKGLSRELNEDHLLDVAARLFNQVRLERLVQDLEAETLRRDVPGAQAKLAAFHPVQLETSAMVNVFHSKDAILDALLTPESEVMVQYPGALGDFFGTHLERDGFVAFLAPEKRGKSFWLIDMAWRSAVMNRRRTLLYSVGDMSQRQMMRRLITRTCRRPFGHGEVEIPKTIRKKKEEGVQVTHVTKAFDHNLSLNEVKTAMKKVHLKSASKTPFLKMRCTPNATTRVADIEGDIDELIKEGWVPDVLVLDYADILAPETASSSADYRNQINDTWKALRRVSQKYHILLVTATQSDAASYDTDTLRRNNFSEDKRKLAHVTGMVGINQTGEEKKIGVFRLNWILLREGSYLESKCVTVAGELAVANPAIISTW